ncbi:MAG: GntR family transcriptional regulator [Halanaerobiales bacterium]|nr:GntR family transcriptional regulator [Halanaerobiales bacterium]
MEKISKDETIPLYKQIKNNLNKMIKEENLQTGDKVPSENEIAELNEVSKATVRRALMALVKEGVLYREQGKGTFVAEKDYKTNGMVNILENSTGRMKIEGVSMKSKVLKFEYVTPDEEIKKNLQLPAETEIVIKVKKLVKDDGNPIVIENSWLSFELFSDLEKDLLDKKTLYEIFRTEYNYELEKSQNIIKPVELNKYQKDLLEMYEKNCGLLLQRKTLSKTGLVLEFSRCIYRDYEFMFEKKLS